MKRNRMCAAALLSGSLALGAITSASPALAAGQPYGCKINPKAAACQKAPRPATVSGVVTGVQGGAPVQTLPATGGGSPTGAAPNLLLVLGGALLGFLGFGIRKLAKQRS